MRWATPCLIEIFSVFLYWDNVQKQLKKVAALVIEGSKCTPIKQFVFQLSQEIKVSTNVIWVYPRYCTYWTYWKHTSLKMKSLDRENRKGVEA